MTARAATLASIESGSTATPISSAQWWTPRLAGPLIAAVAVRLGLIGLLIVRLGAGALSLSDTASYLEPGRNLLLHGRFVADGVPDLVRTPGYPLFLAITSLAGLPTAALVNIALSLVSLFLVWKLSRALFDDERIALGAAWIFAFEPISVTHSVALLSDTLFLVLFLLSAERLISFLRNHDLRSLAAAGLWLAAATFVRPITYYLPFALALALCLMLARAPALRWKAPAVLLISTLPWFAVWQLRNWVETGYAGFSSIREINLYFDVAADVTARIEHRPFLDVRRQLGYFDFTNNSGQFYLSPAYIALHPEQAGWSQGQRLAYMHSEALHVIQAHFGVYVRGCLESFFKLVIDRGSGSFDTLMNPGDSGYLESLVKDKGVAGGAVALARAYPWVAAGKAVFAIMLIGLYSFAARGLFLAVHRTPPGTVNNSCLGLLLATSLYFLAVSAAGSGSMPVGRFRLPVMPVVCSLAAAGLSRTKIDVQ